MTHATPRPWFVRINAVDVPDDPDDGTIYEYEIRKPDRSTSGNEHVATAYDKANAALIVKAVNEYEINRKARLTLEGLTPGGSEYVNDPERCAAYMQRIKSDAVEAHKEVVRLQRKAVNTHDRAKAVLKLALDKLEGMREHFRDKYPLDLSPIRAETAIKALLTDMEG